MLAVVVALILAQEVVPTAPSEAPPPPPVAASPAIAGSPLVPPGDLSTAPPLPTGPLMAVARSARGETFLVVDRAAKVGDTADFWTYEAFVPPVEIRPGAEVVQGLTHHQVDCTANTDQSLATAGYDESGAAIVALAASPAESLVPDSPYGLIAGKLCRGVALPKSGQTNGHAAALAAARAPAGG